MRHALTNHRQLDTDDEETKWLKMSARIGGGGFGWDAVRKQLLDGGLVASQRGHFQPACLTIVGVYLQCNSAAASLFVRQPIVAAYGTIALPSEQH